MGWEALMGSKYVTYRDAQAWNDRYVTYARNADDTLSPAVTAWVHREDQSDQMPKGRFPREHDDRWHDRFPGEQAPLFHMSTSEPHTVEELFASPQHRHMVMPLLGMIQNRALARTGRNAAPSDNLSAHSVTLVNHLRDAGMVSGPPAVRTNSFGFDQDFSNPRYNQGTIERTHAMHDLVDDTEQRQGSQTARAIARALRPPRRQHFDQGTLF